MLVDATNFIVESGAEPQSFKASSSGATYDTGMVDSTSTVVFRPIVQVTHHKGLWTEQICNSSRITGISEHHRKQAYNSLKNAKKNSKYNITSSMHPPLHVASILFLCGGLFLKQAQQPTRLRVLFFYPKAPTVRYYNLNWDDHLLLGLGLIKVILKQIYWWGYCKNFPQPMNIFFLVSRITSSCEHYFQWTLGITHHRVWTIGRNTTVVRVLLSMLMMHVNTY